MILIEFVVKKNMSKFTLRYHIVCNIRELKRKHERNKIEKKHTNNSFKSSIFDRSNRCYFIEYSGVVKWYIFIV